MKMPTSKKSFVLMYTSPFKVGSNNRDYSGDYSGLLERIVRMVAGLVLIQDRPKLHPEVVNYAVAEIKDLLWRAGYERPARRKRLTSQGSR